MINFNEFIESIPDSPYLTSRLNYLCNNKTMLAKYRCDKAKFNHNMIKFGLDNDIQLLVQEYNLFSFQYKYLHREDYKLGYYTYEDLFSNLHEHYKVDFVKLFSNYFRNQYRKLDRVTHKINDIIDLRDSTYNVYFVTLTLRDYYSIENINRDSYNSIRSKIRRFVSKFSCDYILNKDFGLHETKRLHFHGVILLARNELECFKFKYAKKFGNCKLDPINDKSECLARYINKLSFHALKVDYGYCRENFIYSRSKNEKL